MNSSTEAAMDVFEFKAEEQQSSEIEANRFCSNFTITENGIFLCFLKLNFGFCVVVRHFPGMF